MRTTPRPRRTTLLVVDDNAEMRSLIRGLVRGAAFEIHECASGEQALALYRRLHPGVVLMDVRMAGLDGIETTRRICRSDPDARVVIVTEHDDPSVRRAAEMAGACDFLLKDNLLDLPHVLRARLGAGPGTVSS